MAMLVRAGINIGLACLLCVVIGALMGFINGILVAWLNLPPLIATLGTSYVYSSIALVITSGIPVSGLAGELQFSRAWADSWRSCTGLLSGNSGFSLS